MTSAPRAHVAGVCASSGCAPLAAGRAASCAASAPFALPNARTLHGDARAACTRRRRVRLQQRRAARSSPVGLTPKLSLPSADREDPARRRARRVRTSHVRAATAAVRRWCAGGAPTVVARGFRGATL